MQFAVILAAMMSVASAATCDYSVVGPNLQSLGKPIASCMTATSNSYNLARAAAPPTPEQAAAICAKCPDFVKAVTALPPWPDCTMNVGGSDQTLTSYFDKMISGCKGDGAAPANSTATTAAPTTKETTAASSTGSAAKDVAAPTGNSTGTGASAAGSAVTTAPTNASAPVPSPATSASNAVRLSVAAASAVATTIAIVF